MWHRQYLVRMIAVIQRVSRAAVSIDGNQFSNIKQGLVILLGVVTGDDKSDCKYLQSKIAKLRIFQDTNNKMNLNLHDVGGEVLVISQFTLCAETKKGQRPSFINAAKPYDANKLYNLFIDYMNSENITVKTGQFGARMDVFLVNDGPVTFILDSKNKN